MEYIRITLKQAASSRPNTSKTRPRFISEMSVQVKNDDTFYVFYSIQSKLKYFCNKPHLCLLTSAI